MCPELRLWSRCSQRVKALLQTVKRFSGPYSTVQLGAQEEILRAHAQLVDGHLVLKARLKL
jgi:hypothetical protein